MQDLYREHLDGTLKFAQEAPHFMAPVSLTRPLWRSPCAKARWRVALPAVLRQRGDVGVLSGRVLCALLRSA